MKHKDNAPHFAVIRQSGVNFQAKEKLLQEANPAFLSILQCCSVLETKGLICIQATCITERLYK